jgi:hypothetical protein
MNETETKVPLPTLTTELLILPGGEILVHNLTQPFAELLAALNPSCEQIALRALSHDLDFHELPD